MMSTPLTSSGTPRFNCALAVVGNDNSMTDANTDANTDAKAQVKQVKLERSELGMLNGIRYFANSSIARSIGIRMRSVGLSSTSSV